MKELDKILSEFIHIDYGIDCLLEIMKALEEQAESKESREMENILYILNRNFAGFQKEMQINIEKLDKYIMRNR